MITAGVPSRSVDTLIIGAGLTGLSAAYHLPGDYLVVDASDYPGGSASTLRHDGFQLDRGIHILYFRDPWTRFWIEEELGVELVQSHRCSAVQFCDRLVPFPLQFHLSQLGWSNRGRYGIPALWAALSNRGQTSIPQMSDWATAHFGAPLKNAFFKPYNEKLYQQPFEEITTAWMDGYIPKPSAWSVFTGLLSSRKGRFGSNATFWYPRRGGTSSISEALAERVGPIQYGTRLLNVDLEAHTAEFDDGSLVSYRKLVSTIPLTAMLGCVKNTNEFPIESAVRLRIAPTAIAHLLLDRQVDAQGLHWLYVADPAVRFHRLVFPRNVAEYTCPPGRSAITIEYGGEVDDREAAETSSKEALIRMGLLNESDRSAQLLWDEVLPGYVNFDEHWKDSRSEILAYLRRYDVLSIGRYGRWEYSNMESALLQGRQVHRRLEDESNQRVKIAFSRKDGAQGNQRDDYSARSRPRPMPRVSHAGEEPDRLRVVGKWVPNCEGLDVAGIGCGDGVFLRGVLNGTASRIRLEDLEHERVVEAHSRLSHKGDWVEAVACDSHHHEDPTTYDVVFAIGLFDCEEDWAGMLDRLLKRTHGILIADFPRSGSMRHRLRKGWLSLHGVDLSAATRNELATLLESCGADYEVMEMPLHWLAKIQKREVGGRPSIEVGREVSLTETRTSK